MTSDWDNGEAVMRRRRHEVGFLDGIDAASPPIRSRAISADRRAQIIARAGRLRQHYEEQFRRARDAYEWRRATEMGMVADGMAKLIERLQRSSPYR